MSTTAPATPEDRPATLKPRSQGSAQALPPTAPPSVPRPGSVHIAAGALPPAHRRTPGCRHGSRPWPRPKLVLRAGALAGGDTDGETQARARGVWASAMRSSSPAPRQDAVVEPADGHRAATTTFAHGSPETGLQPSVGGILHESPLWRTVLGPVQVMNAPNRGRRGSGLQTYPAQLEADEIVMVDHWSVTSAGWTSSTSPGRCRSSRHWRLPTLRCLEPDRRGRSAEQLERSATLPACWLGIG